MKVLVTIALCLSVIVIASAQNCDNPMHSSVESGALENIIFLDTPAVYTGPSKVCAGAFDNTAQCCSDPAYASMTVQWAIVRREMDTAVAELEESRKQFDASREQFEGFEDEIDNDKRLTQQEKDALRGFMNTLFDAFEKFIDGVIETYVPCAESILRFVVRYVCLMCDAEWDQYLTRPGNQWWRITWENEVCTDLSENCGDFFDIFVELANSLQDAFEELVDAGIIDSDDSEEDDDFDPCEGLPCSDYICKHMISNPNYDPPFEDNDDSKRIAENSMLTKLRSSLGKYADIVKPVEHALKMKNTLHMLRRDLDTEGDFKESLFSANGYNYDTSKSELDTHVSPAASLSSWLF